MIDWRCGVYHVETRACIRDEINDVTFEFNATAASSAARKAADSVARTHGLVVATMTEHWRRGNGEVAFVATLGRPSPYDRGTTLAGTLRLWVREVKDV
jgi:hypothetical protein